MKYILGWQQKIAFLCIGIFLIGATVFFANFSGLTITGNEILTNPDEIIISNSTVESGGDLTLKAGNRIIHKPGFHAKSGSKLTAQIDPNLEGLNLVMPPTVGNDRFLEELYPQMKRPGLSIIGFDNGGDYPKGLGLKQQPNAG